MIGNGLIQDRIVAVMICDRKKHQANLKVISQEGEGSLLIIELLKNVNIQAKM
jgi:Flp pilus assembly protein TadB